jgi:membrane protease YdiL (CAAX protease family)
MAKLRVSENRNLFLFFLIAYGFTWLFWISETLASRGLLGSSILVDFLLGPYNPAAWGPFVSAVLLSVWHNKGTGLLGLLKRGVEVRFPKRWWIPTFLLCPLMIGGAFLISILAGNSIPELDWIADPFLLVSSFFLILVTGGPLQEEFGWRGYALPRLQGRFNALYSSLILGFMWGLWHLPYFFIGTEITYAYGIFPQIFTAIMLSILLTWLFNNTRGSVLVSLIFHNTFNWSMANFPALQTSMGSPFFITFLIIAAVIVVAIWKPKRLARGMTDEN